MIRDWDFKGVFGFIPKSFFGRRGIVPGDYSPYPSGTVSASLDDVVTPGASTLTCHAVNTVAYQWQMSRDDINWANITDETKKTLERFWNHEAGAAGDYYYRALCRGWLGVAATPSHKISVSYHAPVVSISASASHVTSPASIELTADAEFADSYEWQRNSGDGWKVIAGGATSSDVYQYGDGGLYGYRCIVTGLGGSAESNTVTVYVAEPMPEITASCDKEFMSQGETATLTADAIYADSFEWQYYSNGIWLTLASTSTVDILPTSIGLNKYRCIAMGLGGNSISNVVEVTLNPASPVISINADKTDITAGDSITISADYYPESTNLQWQTCESDTWVDLSAHGHLIAIDFPDAGQYLFRCCGDNYGLKTTSNTITITVSEPEPEGR